MPLLNEIRWGLVARFAWVYLTVGILLLGFGTFLVEPVGVVPFRDLMPFMILLSFPAGLFAFLFAFPLDISPPFDFFLLWAVTFIAGYIQWFHIVPKFRRTPRIITLSLNQALCAPVRADPQPEPMKVPPQQKRRTRKEKQRVLHYDAAGRTPLERALFFGPQKSISRSRK